jgi:hypothetical protein
VSRMTARNGPLALADHKPYGRYIGHTPKVIVSHRAESTCGADSPVRAERLRIDFGPTSADVMCGPVITCSLPSAFPGFHGLRPQDIQFK